MLGVDFAFKISDEILFRANFGNNLYASFLLCNKTHFLNVIISVFKLMVLRQVERQWIMVEKNLQSRSCSKTYPTKNFLVFSTFPRSKFFKDVLTERYFLLSFFDFLTVHNMSK